MVTFTKFMERMYNSRNKQDKIDILMSVEDDMEILNLLYYALSSEIVFGIKNWDEPPEYSEIDSDIEMFLDLLKALSQSSSNSINNREMITYTLMQYTEETSEVFAKIIRKNLGSGITVKLINEAYPNYIPTFDIGLCFKFEERHRENSYFIEPKFDGVRLIAIYGSNDVKYYYSRKGKLMPQLSCILNEDMDSVYKRIKFPFVLDGELTAENFDKTISLKAPSAVDKSGLKFNVFDVVPYIEWMDKSCFLPLKERKTMLMDILGDKLKTIRFVQHCLSENSNELDIIYNHMVGIGFEGIVLKEPNSLYVYKRSQNWIKMKPVNTYTGRIIDVNRGTGKYIDCMGSVLVMGEDLDVPFEVKVGSGFSDKLRKQIWNNRLDYIGSFIEVKAQSMTKDYSLRFPIFKRFLEYDD